METDDVYGNYDSEDDEVQGEDGDTLDPTSAAYGSSDSDDSEPEDSGFITTNENGGSQELTLFDGPSVLIQPSLDDEDEGEDGKKYIGVLFHAILIKC